VHLFCPDKPRAHPPTTSMISLGVEQFHAAPPYLGKALPVPGETAERPVPGRASGSRRPMLLKVRQAKPGGVGSHVKENATENF
jgi:hypothetical protein